MDTTATEPLTIRSLRAKALREGLTIVAQCAIVGLFFMGIGFNSNDDTQQWSVFTIMIPAFVILLLVKYQVERQQLEIGTPPRY